MNIGLAATTFAVVVPAELPDKTFISTVVLSSRHRPLPVLIGAISGLVLQASIAAVLGRLLGLLSHRLVDAIVAALFFGGAIVLLVVPETHVAEQATEISLEESASLEDDPQGEESKAAGRRRALASGAKIAITTFFVIAIAEFGDITQIVIANLSARSRDPLSVFVGGAVAFVVIASVGVAAGRTLARIVPLALVRSLSAIVLCGFGLWSAVSAAGG